MYLTLEISKTKTDKTFILKSFHDAKRSEPDILVTASSYDEFKSNLSVFPQEASIWALEVAKTKRLKVGKAISLDYNTEGIVEAQRFLILGTKDQKAEAVILEYGGHNKEPVEVGDTVYPPNFLINFGGEAYAVAKGSKLCTAIDPDGSYSHIIYMELDVKTQTLYDILTGIPEENEHKDGDMGISNGALGVWSKANYVIAGGTVISFPEFKFPVFRIKNNTEIKFQVDDIVVPHFEESPSDPCGLREIKELMEFGGIYTSMIMQAEGESYYFTVTNGDPLKISIFNLERPNLHDTANFIAHRKIKAKDLNVNNIPEALIMILKLVNQGADEIPASHLLKMFK